MTVQQSVAITPHSAVKLPFPWLCARSHFLPSRLDSLAFLASESYIATVQLQNITNSRQKLGKRQYDDACGLAHALELIGERWAMLVLRELAYGPRRFSELKAELQGISANVLAERLGALEERGLGRKIKLPPPASRQGYAATES